MNKDVTVRARVEHNVKEEVEAILEKIGLSTTEAIRIYFKQILLRKGIPFSVEIPNKTTRKAIEDARKGKGINFENVDKLTQYLNQ